MFCRVPGWRASRSARSWLTALRWRLSWDPHRSRGMIEPLLRGERGELGLGAVISGRITMLSPSSEMSFGGIDFSCPAEIRFRSSVVTASSRWWPRAIFEQPSSRAMRYRMPRRGGSREAVRLVLGIFSVTIE